MSRNTSRIDLLRSKREKGAVTHAEGSKEYRIYKKSRRKCEEHLQEVSIIRPELHFSFVIIEINQLSLPQLSLHTVYLFFLGVWARDAPLQFFDVPDDLGDRAMVFHHFLVMAAALVSRPTLDDLTHHDIDL